MRSRRCLNKFLSEDRRMLYMILSIVLFSVFTLTVVYAALSTTLNITGTAQVTAASWDIYLDNVQLNSQSATTTVATITDKVTATFSTTLTNPGDFYEFTVDVVNNGSIDAMIDSVTKTPELTDNQKKYLNYIVEYQNGESINTKHLVEKNSYVRLKVKVVFRKDISASDLPSASETLNLAFRVNYVQSDEAGVSVDNNGNLLKIVSGDLETVGSEIAIGDEHFYLMSNVDGKITMLAKYNLYVGNECTLESSSSCTAYSDEATRIQDLTMKGYVSGQSVRNGTTPFSSTSYWSSIVSSYSAYVYNSNSSIYNYVENYKTYLQNQGVEIEEARLIKEMELDALGCGEKGCLEAPDWVYSTSYWAGFAFNTKFIYAVDTNGSYRTFSFSNDYTVGVRPVIIFNP